MAIQYKFTLCSIFFSELRYTAFQKYFGICQIVSTLQA